MKRVSRYSAMGFRPLWIRDVRVRCTIDGLGMFSTLVRMMLRRLDPDLLRTVVTVAPPPLPPLKPVMPPEQWEKFKAEFRDAFKGIKDCHKMELVLLGHATLRRSGRRWRTNGHTGWPMPDAKHENGRRLKPRWTHVPAAHVREVA